MSSSAAVTGEGQVTSRGEVSSRRLHVARAELVLARDLSEPLRPVPLRPDPLSAFADTAGVLLDYLDERFDVVLDIVPLNAAKARHMARRESERAQQRSMAGGQGSRWGSFLREITEGADPLSGSSGGRASARSPRPAKAPPTARTKFDDPQPCFAFQLLLRVESAGKDRAPGILQRLLAAADQWSGENYFIVRSRRIGWARWGSDSILFRRSFDRRFASGQLDPARLRQVVTARELAPLLKPPTKHCASAHVQRSGGKVPAAPHDLPTYVPGAADCIPLGYAAGRDGRERLLGMNIDELLFSFRIGKSGFGKTELALCQAVALARAGHGIWFLDPHGDGWRRAREFLTEHASRIWEIDLESRSHDATLASWNLLSMEGQSREGIEARVDLVVSAFAAALSWGDSAPRAKTLLTKACETLCELALVLPADIAPTIFQIPRLLEDELWRAALVPFLPPSLQTYWDVSYPRIATEATGPVTHLIQRLRSSPTMTAFFGASRSTYDVRRAMDNDAIVMLLTPDSGEYSKLISCLLIYDLFRAGRSRGNMPADARRRCDAFVDELTQVDGAARGTIAAILEQLRKFNVRLHAMTQMADRLTEDTRRALLQNQSLLSTSAGGIDEVRVATKQWPGMVSAETASLLPKYHHIMSVQHHGQASAPFKVRGPQVTELFAEASHPDRVEAMREQLDANLARRPIRETLAELDGLDDAIVRWLSANAQPRMRDAAPSTPDAPPSTSRNTKTPKKQQGTAAPTSTSSPPRWDSDTSVPAPPSNVISLADRSRS